MRTRYILVLTLIILYITTFPPVSSNTQTSTGNTRDITVITKTVCFNVSVSDPLTNKTSSKEICIVIDFHVKNSKPSNNTINVTFPVYVNVGNKTIEKKVVVPLQVTGEVSKIIVRSENTSSLSSTGGNENVIVVAHQQATSTTITSTVKHTTTTNTVKRTSSSIQHTITQHRQTVTKVVTHTVAKTNKSNNMNDTVLTILIVVILLGVGVLVLYKKPEKKKEEKEEKSSKVEDYEEALKLLKQKLNEKEQELEKTRNTFPYKIRCPFCNNLINPIVTDDNRLLCPVCHQEIGKIREDGSLELYNTNENEEPNTEQEDNNGEESNNDSNTKTSRRRRRKN